MAYAEQIGKVVLLALETIELKDAPQTTFFGQPAEDFSNVQAEVIETLKERSGFGGMLTHCWQSVRDMMQVGEAY